MPIAPPKKGKNPHKVPKADLRPVSVPGPTDMLQVYKDIAATRQEETNLYTPLRIIHEEALQSLLSDILAGKPIRFAPSPKAGFTRRTIWIHKTVLDRARDLARARNIHISTVVVTALLRYLAKKGVTFEGFPSEF
jgi:hypothetical protein